MPLTYLLNSPVLTAYGRWEFRGPIDAGEARRFLTGGFVSAIGHAATAEFLQFVLKQEVPLNRVRVEMRPGDRAVVVRILERLPEGKVLGAEEFGKVPYELGVLTRLE